MKKLRKKLKKDKSYPCYSVLWKTFCTLFKVYNILSSFLVFFMWVSLTFVEDDIKRDVNWYITFMNHFTEEYDFYHVIKSFSLVLVVLYLLCQSITLLTTVFCVVQINASNNYSSICKVLFLPVLIVNSLLFYILKTIGSKIWQMFLLSAPLIIAKMASSNIYIISIIMMTSLLAYLYHKVFWRKQSHLLNLVLLFHVALILLTISVNRLTVTACDACSTKLLPVKPVLTAHRGCPTAEYPGNSIKAFTAASRMDAVITLESDIQVSQDQELFLLHDPFLVTTTTVMESCPKQDPFLLASKYLYNSGDCPLRSLQLKEDTSQIIPTLDHLLKIAKETQKNVIFDLRPPHPGHKYQDDYIELTLKSIVGSQIELDKIWWLHDINRSLIHSRYPQLTLVAKTQFTSIEDFKKLNIKIANEEWSTPLSIIRKLKSLDISINMYTISTPLLFEYAWCLGVESVTTNSCKQFSSSIMKNDLHKYCHSSSLITGLITIILLCPIVVPLIFSISNFKRKIVKMLTESSQHYNSE